MWQKRWSGSCYVTFCPFPAWPACWLLNQTVKIEGQTRYVPLILPFKYVVNYFSTLAFIVNLYLCLSDYCFFFLIFLFPLMPDSVSVLLSLLERTCCHAGGWGPAGPDCPSCSNTGFCSDSSSPRPDHASHAADHHQHRRDPADPSKKWPCI